METETVVPVLNAPLETHTIRYPVDVWSGTYYGRFAELCGAGNNIPREFFIESLKTFTGAIVGSQLSLKVNGGIPRFYTILIGPAASGKGTAINYAFKLFDDGIGDLGPPFLWGAQTRGGSNLGACQAAFSSLPGLQRIVSPPKKPPKPCQSRILWVAEEVDSIFEAGGIKGSGGALLAAIRSLYDSEVITATGTGERDSCQIRAKVSILGGTTPDLWRGMFAGSNAPGSGLFGRLNLIFVEDSNPVSSLIEPDFTSFREEFFRFLRRREKSLMTLSVDPEASRSLADWFADLRSRALGEESDRLNVLAWRNALHLAWLRESPTVTVDHITDAIRLSEYQLVVRRFTKPLVGDSSVAKAEDAIRTYIRGKMGEFVTKRKLENSLKNLKAKVGVYIWGMAIENLKNEGCVQSVKRRLAATGPETAGFQWVDE